NARNRHERGGRVARSCEFSYTLKVLLEGNRLVWLTRTHSGVRICSVESKFFRYIGRCAQGLANGVIDIPTITNQATNIPCTLSAHNFWKPDTRAVGRSGDLCKRVMSWCRQSSYRLQKVSIISIPSGP